MLTKRVVGWIWVVIAVFLLSAQCSTFSQLSEGLPQAEPAEPVELVYVSADPNNPTVEVLIEQFETMHPNITVRRENFQNSYERYLTDETLEADVLDFIVGYNALAAVDEGLLIDISQVWSDGELDQIYPASFQSFGQQGGRHYLLPLFYSWFGIYYNEAVFNENGLTSPQNWGDFLTTCQILLNNNVTPLALPGEEETLTLWFDYLNLRLNGPEFYNDLLRGRERFDDARVRDVLYTWQELLADGCFGEGPRSSSATQHFDALRKGETAMILTSPGAIGQLPDDWRQDLRFFRFPDINPDVTPGEVTAAFGLLIPRQTENPAAAITFLTYIISPEAQQLFFQQQQAEQEGTYNNTIPLHDTVAQSEYTSEMLEGMAIIEAAEMVSPSYLFSVPFERANTAASAFRGFYLNYDDIEPTIKRLESLREQIYGNQEDGS